MNKTFIIKRKIRAGKIVGATIKPGRTSSPSVPWVTAILCPGRINFSAVPIRRRPIFSA